MNQDQPLSLPDVEKIIRVRSHQAYYMVENANLYRVSDVGGSMEAIGSVANWKHVSEWPKEEAEQLKRVIGLTADYSEAQVVFRTVKLV
jgi:hypothetical protein